MKILFTLIRSVIAYVAFSIFVLYIILIFPFVGDKIFTYGPFATRMILRIMGVKVELEGTYPEDDSSYIVMFNHVSFIELFLLTYVFDGRKFSALTAAKNLKIPMMGSLLRTMKVVPVFKGGTKEEAIATIKKAEAILQEGYQIILSPEGTRTTTGKLGPLKKGGFHMAFNTQTDILPIGFEGTFEYKPKTRSYLKPGTIKIRIGEPIAIKNYQLADMDQLVQTVANNLKELSGEIDTSTSKD